MRKLQVKNQQGDKIHFHRRWIALLFFVKDSSQLGFAGEKSPKFAVTFGEFERVCKEALFFLGPQRVERREKTHDYREGLRSIEPVLGNPVRQYHTASIPEMSF